MISDPKFENGERSCYMNDRGCNIPRNEEWRGGLKKRGGNLKPGRGERVIGRIEGRIQIFSQDKRGEQIVTNPM